MSSRRKARASASNPLANVSTIVPVELRAGACMELWAPGESTRAWRRYRRARLRWLEAHGLHPHFDDERAPVELRPSGDPPWSFDYIRVERPDDLAGRLVRCGLPPDWVPVFVESFDYGPSLVPENMTWAEHRAWRARASGT